MYLGTLYKIWNLQDSSECLKIWDWRVLIVTYIVSILHNYITAPDVLINVLVENKSANTRMYILGGKIVAK